MHDQAFQTQKIHCQQRTELDEVARQIITFAGEHTVWIFEGEMGAGKTTLIRQIGEELGVVDNITSPTFALVNEYATDQNATLYHFDFYRIKEEQEALDMGIEEYFDSGNICLVEWPSKVAGLLPELVVEIKISPGVGEDRTFHLNLASYEREV